VKRTVTASDARELTDVVTRLRRALRRSIRTDYPWESRPMAQIEVLQSLAETGPSRVSDLAERLRLAQSTVSTLVGKLSAAGLLTRDTHPEDRRASVVALTADGREDMRSWDSAHRQRLSGALRSLVPSDRSAILEALPALGRLVDALEAGA
jgi:DNA-binding MarR family transcriptional regulator